jgi:1,4-alpha-glucan branching enzyme
MLNALIITVNPTQSFTDYRVGVDVPGEYGVVLSSDEKRFGGHERVDLNGKYFTTGLEWNNRKNWLQVGAFTSYARSLRAEVSYDHER